MPSFLKPVAGGKEIRLDKPILFVGRHPDCDIVLNDSRKVSRKHCCISQINTGFVIRDLGSMNGIRVNSTLTRKNQLLQDGDEVTIGDVVYLFVSPSVSQKKETIDATPQDLSGEVPVAIDEQGQPEAAISDSHEIPESYPIRRKSGSDSAVEISVD